jgi:cytochrome c oxidase cbb3-type subunit 3
VNIRLSLPILISCGCLIVTGCSKEQEKEQEHKAAAVTAEQISAEVVSVDPALAQQGKVLYEQNCVFCHQADAIGKPGFAPSLTNQEFLSVVSDKFLLSTVRDGRPGTGMPPFAHLGRKDVEAIVAFLREHAKIPNVSADIDAQPHTQGDPRLGQFWFDSICVTCHGPNGDGYSAGGTGTAIGKAGFLDKASDGFIRTTIKQGRSNTRMIGYSGPEAMAALTDRDIDDIIAFLRTVPSK